LEDIIELRREDPQQRELWRYSSRREGADEELAIR